MNPKTKVIQQVLDPNGIGGVSSEFKALEKSTLTEKYEFIPVVLKNCHAGISLKDIRYYIKHFKAANADIIQIRGAGIDGLNAQIAAKFTKAKTLLCIHGIYSDMVYYSKLKHFVAKRIVEPLCYRLADGISCVYENCQNRPMLQKRKKKLVQFVYNRMPNYDELNKAELREEFRVANAIPQEAFVGVFCGRISKEKGLTYLLDALTTLSKNWPENFLLLIVGDGDFKATFEEAINANPVLSQNILLTGEMKNVTPALAASDFFLFPSLHENHSIALLEALAMGLPTIATKVGGNPEIIEDQTHGLLIEAHSASAIVNSIVAMCDREKHRVFAENIKETSFARFSNQNVDSQLDKAYQQLLSK